MREGADRLRVCVEGEESSVVLPVDAPEKVSRSTSDIEAVVYARPHDIAVFCFDLHCLFSPSLAQERPEPRCLWLSR